MAHHSDILNRKIYCHTSTQMIRTLKKYGGLDRFLLLGKDKLVGSSKLAVVLKKLLLEKQKNPSFKLPRMACFNKKPRKQKYYSKCAIPPIYVAPELMRNPVVQFIKYDVNQLSRIEQTRIDTLKKELNEESDVTRRAELREEIDKPDKEREKLVKSELLYLQKYRHETLRRYLMRYEQTYEIKQNLIRTFENAELDLKTILGDDYKHYSEDFPEVQLILQKAELQRQKKTLKFMSSYFKNPTNEMGTLAENEADPENVLSLRSIGDVTIKKKQHKQDLLEEKKKILFRRKK